ncbi:MAG: hypothetical protein ABR585_13885 [Gemmatimonadaceae bacterium]
MKVRLLILGSFAAMLAACAGNSRPDLSNRPTATAIRVENETFSDMTIYASHSSERVRLGLAPGHATTVFQIPSILMSGMTTLRFIADPIGGNRASVSEEIMVTPGDSVVMTIPPTT